MTSSIGSSFSPRRLVGAEHHARPRHRQLEALAPHVLDQDAELQFPAPGHIEGILVGVLGDADGDVALRLLQQPLANDAALHLVAFLPRQRPVVDAKRHRQRRRIDRLRRDRRIDRRIAQRVGHGSLGDACNGDDVARESLIDSRALQPAERQHLGHARRLDQLAVARQRLDGLVRLDAARGDAPGQHAAKIGISLQRRCQQAERTFRHCRRRHVADDEIEERR